MKRVVIELFKGFKEIFLVAVLLIVLIFVFANIAVHMFGMRFAACNDHTILHRENCTGGIANHIFGTLTISCFLDLYLAAMGRVKKCCNSNNKSPPWNSDLYLSKAR